MLLIIILAIIYVIILAICAGIMTERRIEPNPVSIFIVVCPIVNLIYVIYRLKGSWKSWIEDL